MAYKGEVQNWIPGKGYGFVKCQDLDEELFVHFSSFGGGDLEIGKEITFDVADDRGGKKMATNVRGPAVLPKDSRRHEDRHDDRRRGGYDDRDRGYDRRDDRDRGYDRRGGYDDRDRGYDRRGGYDDRDRGYDRRGGYDERRRDDFRRDDRDRGYDRRGGYDDRR